MLKSKFFIGFSMIILSAGLFISCAHNETLGENTPKPSDTRLESNTKAPVIIKPTATREPSVTKEPTVTKEPNLLAMIDGYYLWKENNKPFPKKYFHIKTAGNVYKAVFMCQLEDDPQPWISSYYEGTATKSSDGTKCIEFVSVDITYIVSMQDAGSLYIEAKTDDAGAKDFQGKYEKTDGNEFMDGEVEVPAKPEYEADKHVESGVEIDSTLATAIRKELDYAKDYVLTRSDLKNITRLAIWEDFITSLKGIKELENLTEIVIRQGSITDIAELSRLPKLQLIDISGCYIEKIPDLSALKELKELRLISNLIKDISPLVSCTQLEIIDVSCNRIQKITPLKTLKNLTMLALTDNAVLDFSEVADSKTLRSAIANGCQCKFEDCIKAEKEAKKVVKKITKGMNSQLEKEVAIYKYLIATIQYNDKSYSGYAYGYRGLIRHEGVCGNYAEAFALLANHAGLECFTCSSDTHAWNIIKIDGTYYHCDNLWDQSQSPWIYFNRSTAFIDKQPNHKHNLNRYPYCAKSMDILDYYTYMNE